MLHLPAPDLALGGRIPGSSDDSCDDVRRCGTRDKLARVFWRTQTGVGSLRGMAGVWGGTTFPIAFFNARQDRLPRLPTNRLKCIRQSGQSASKWAVGTLPTADCKSSPVGSRQSGKCAVFSDYRLGGSDCSALDGVVLPNSVAGRGKGSERGVNYCRLKFQI
jgi:hypothetical protein